MHRTTRMGMLGVSILALASLARAQERAASTPDAVALFLANCASCHGETGDGNGVTKLDRPARSFKDGGFSFGNTPEALFRTLTTGIPGTPMPGFEGSLGVAERRALAAYVITLGPPVTEVEVEDTLLMVGERPVVARGMMPSLGEGLPEHPRGLLVGLTVGFSFQYRTDDVRLLAVRQGAFAERMDWIGRGGDELNPLGKVVRLEQGGDPSATFARGGDQGALEPLVARFTGSFVLCARAGLTYRLLDGRGTPVAPVADVREDVAARGSSLGSGYRRRLLVTSEPGADLLWIRVPTEGLAPLIDPRARPSALDALGPYEVSLWQAFRRADGLVDLIACWVDTNELAVRADGPGTAFGLRIAPGATHTIELSVLVLPEWNEGVEAQLDKEWK